MGEYSHLRDTARYQSNTLIGNWNEERELRRSTLKDVLAKKTTGSLRLDAFQQRMAVALQEVELSKSQDDAYVHFGDVLQLVHLETGSALACDVGDVDTRPGEMACAATAATQVTAPCARNTFILTRYVAPPGASLEPDYPDSVLRYGQKLHLAAHPCASGQEVDAAGGPRPLRLFSKPVSTTHFAKYCHNQLVGFTYRNSHDTVWQVVTPDPSQRALSEGIEVLAGAPIMLLHCATQKPLVVENQKYPNDFGLELELSARSTANKGMKSACEMSNKGLLRGTLPKSDSSETFWSFMPGTQVVVLPPPRTDLSQTAAAALQAVASVVSELQSRHGGIQPLERKLVTWSTRDQHLPAEEVLLLLRQVGILAAEQLAGPLAAHFQVPDRPGVVDAAALLDSLRAASASGAAYTPAAGGIAAVR